MKRVIIDNPPKPDDYKNNPLAYMRAVSDWMNRTKQKIETASLQK